MNESYFITVEKLTELFSSMNCTELGAAGDIAGFLCALQSVYAKVLRASLNCEPEAYRASMEHAFIAGMNQWKER